MEQGMNAQLYATLRDCQLAAGRNFCGLHRKKKRH